MWADEVMPRLRARGLGADTAIRTFRLTGIGESTVAELLGEELLRRPDPEVATYARAEAVDVRVSASGTDATGSSPTERVEAAAAVVRERLGEHIWAEGDTTWSEAIGERLDELGWRLTVDELGTGGQVAALLGDVPWLAVARGRPLDAEADHAAEPADDGGGLVGSAGRARDAAGVEVGLAVKARPRGSELAVTVAVVSPRVERRQTRTTYVGGSMGRSQAALIATATLLDALREE
jgi:hypothetical protein